MPETASPGTLSGKTADRILDFVANGICFLAALLPPALLTVLGAGIGRLLWLLNTQTRHITEVNLAHCFPALPVQQRQRLAKNSVIESSKVLLEVIAIWASPLEKNRARIKRVSGMACVEEALQKKRGMIVLGPHLGNWELAGMFCAELGPFTALYAPAKIGVMRKIMFAGRRRYGCKLAPTDNSGVKALLKALKAGESVGILPDQVPELEGGLFAPFFGEPALTMTLVANLAARTGAAVICCYAKRMNDESGFEICLRPAAELIASNNLQEAVVALNQSVEACVNDCPEQYQWEYKRFKRRPAGLPRLY